MMKNIRKEDFLMDCYPTVEEVLRFSVFERSRLLTPTISLDLPVCGVNLTDTPDYMNLFQRLLRKSCQQCVLRQNVIWRKYQIIWFSRRRC